MSYWDKLFRIFGEPIWTCSKCGHKKTGAEIESRITLSASNDRDQIQPCNKCHHVDAPMKTRSNYRHPKSGRDAYSIADPAKSPWWSKRKPLWTVS